MRALRIQVARPPVIPTLCLAVLLAIGAADASSSHARHKTGTVSRVRPAPRAVIPFNSFSFGDVYRGEVISQIFVIKNEGDAELRIKDFKGDCGCTATRSDSVIPPGKEGIAEVEVQTVSQSGLINKTAILHTNDPDQPVITFTLIANVLAGAPLRQGKHIGPVFLSPDSRGSMYAPAGKKATTEFSVTADDTPVRVLRVEGGTKNFASRVEVVEPGRRYKILVESLQIETGGLYTDQLRVVTDNPTLPAFTVDLTLRVYDKQ
jgi:hypothetical protein